MKEIPLELNFFTRGEVKFPHQTSDVSSMKKITKTEKAGLVGTLIAKKAVEKGIKKCAFDRNGYLYHGRVKSLADSAREGGLNF